MGRQLEQLNLWGDPETCNYTNKYDCFYSGCVQCTAGTCAKYTTLPERITTTTKGGTHTDKIKDFKSKIKK